MFNRSKVNKVPFFSSIIFKVILGLILFDLILVLSVDVVMNTQATDLVLRESSRVVEQVGNNMVRGLQKRLNKVESLAKSMANIGEQLPKKDKIFKHVVKHLVNFDDDFSIAGGGIWYEPSMFKKGVSRKSFFWARDSKNDLVFLDDYNRPGLSYDENKYKQDKNYKASFLKSPGYHNEEWYVVAEHLKSSKNGFWSKSYMDPYSLQPMVTITVPMRDKFNNFIGVSTVDLKLEGLHEYVEKWKKETGGYIFVMDRNDKFITFPKGHGAIKILKNNAGKTISKEFLNISEYSNINSSYSNISKKIKETNRKLLGIASLDKNHDTKLSSLIDQESYQIDTKEAQYINAVITNSKNDKETSSSLIKIFNIKNDIINNDESVVSVFRMTSSYWKVVIVKPFVEYIVVAKSIKNNLMKTFFILVILMLFCAFYCHMKFIGMPLNILINNFSHISDEIIKGNLLEDIEKRKIIHKPNDEIGVLVNSFNQMTDNIVKLEIERTKNIKILNETKVELIKTSKAKSIFLSSMSHEIRTPLNAIISTADILQDTALDEKSAGLIDILRRGGDTLLNIVNSILDLSKIESGNYEVQNTPFDLSKSLNTVTDLIGMHVKDKNLEFIVDIDESVPKFIKGDNVTLSKILINILGNAVKYTRAGTISFKVTSETSSNNNKQGSLLLKVEDTGVGIPDDKKDFIFEEFSVLYDNGNHHQKVGLGLNITKKLVLEHDGKIWFDSEVGKGSTFYVSIPFEMLTNGELEQAKQDFQEHEVGSSQLVNDESYNVAIDGQKKYKILIADDSPDNLLLVGSYLNKFPCDITFVENGKEALDVYKKQDFDIVLMDMQMPIMDGREATREIIKWVRDNNLKQVPIIALTAYGFKEDIDECLEAGCYAHITKPVHKKKFLGLLSRYLNETLRG